MPGSVDVDLVLPVLDEAAALPWVLERVPAGVRPIVVDNGSTDGSAEVARALGALVVLEPRRGFGAACAAGLAHATAPLVAFCDADASLDPAELPRLVAAVEQGGGGLALGARHAGAGWVALRAFPPHARVANAVLAAQIRRRAGVALRDLGPMRVAPRVALVELGISDRRFGWPLEMVLRAAAAGWPVVEVPVSYRPRTGRSKVTGTVRGTVRAVRDMSAVLRDLDGAPADV